MFYNIFALKLKKIVEFRRWFLVFSVQENFIRRIN